MITDPEQLERQQYESWQARIADSPVVDLFAVAAPGPMGLTRSSTGHSIYIVSCLAYRVVGELDAPVVIQDLVAEMPVSGGSQAVAPDHAIQPYRIVHLRVRLAESEQGKLRAQIDEIVKSVVRGDPLESIVDDLKQPLVVHDVNLGDLILDRRFGYFEGQIRYRWRRVDISIQSASPNELHQCLPAFKPLIDNLKQIDADARKSVTDELQEIYNSNWRAPWRPALRGNALGRKIRLDYLTFHPGSRLTLCYDAGRLFCDHEIEVRCEPDGTVFEVCVSG